MKKRGKKGIVIISIIILIIALLAGVAFAYLKTDLFKSEQTLFFKYMGKALESFEYVENTQNIEIEKKKQENPYNLNANLKYEKGEEIEDVNSNILSNMNLQIEAKVNKKEEKAYAKANLNYQNESLFSLEYANSNNIYALKSDEIITAFLGIENSNLKILAQKLGIIDTTKIPDTINQINLNDLLLISNEDKEHIKETYLSVLINVISQNNFKKEKNVEIQREGINYTATAYRLDLNAEELKQVKIEVLQALKEDSITLDLLATKAKLLGLDENYTQVNNLTNMIQMKINEINNGNYISDADLSIIIYTNNEEVIMTEVIYKNEVKYTIYGNRKENVSSKYILVEQLENTSQNNKIEINIDETRNDNETNYSILVNINNNIGINANIVNTVATEDNNINTNCEIILTQLENVISIINYEQEINFEEQIENTIELNTSNCGVLNNYTTEQLKVLIQSIAQRIEAITKEKVQKIGWQEINIKETISNEAQNNGIDTDIPNLNNVDNNTIMINEVNVTNEISSISNDIITQNSIENVTNSNNVV